MEKSTEKNKKCIQILLVIRSVTFLIASSTLVIAHLAWCILYFKDLGNLTLEIPKFLIFINPTLYVLLIVFINLMCLLFTFYELSYFLHLADNKIKSKVKMIVAAGIVIISVLGGLLAYALPTVGILLTLLALVLSYILDIKIKKSESK
ncbi:hypothetical protein ACM9HF_11535 [Colwellia sp. RE-S-Sl-9]